MVENNDIGPAPAVVDLIGVDVIRGYLKTLPGTPGVYRMIDRDGAALYVGKAKNLKKRVASYTNLNRQSIRIKRMICQDLANGVHHHPYRSRSAAA